MALISYHRGGSETHEPATIAAYEAAIQQGAELVEVDVWRSTDGVLFCAHDEFDDDGARVADRTWSEIQRLHPETPSFEHVLGLCNGVSICHVDLKARGYELDATALAIDVLDDPAGSAWFTTLEDTSVRLIRRHHPDLLAILSLGRDSKGKSRLWTARTRLGEFVPFIRMHRSRCGGVAVNYRLLSLPVKLFCRKTDRRIMVWTVNADTKLEKFLRDPAVDVVITDRPLAATKIRDRLP